MGAVIRRRAIVTGDVQGVGFRWSAREAAQRLGVTGWARNRLDGSVEAEVEGEPEQVERMLAWLRTGPPGASVESVTVSDTAPLNDTAFRIHETA
ncbi:acylphosphatase [Leifsonia sp. LS-T14]|uniref:acylphosphatase n=1 Tax=unclassified Leifsonia TaxID=2663824 RepID=UPI0035A6ECBA